jgi:hypothetical protein
LIGSSTIAHIVIAEFQPPYKTCDGACSSRGLFLAGRAVREAVYGYDSK